MARQAPKVEAPKLRRERERKFGCGGDKKGVKRHEKKSNGDQS
jgi:hypothetical protein